MGLTFATGNAGKFAEAQAVMASRGITLEPWTHGYTEVQADTLDEVALAGAAELAPRIDGSFFLEDAGLFVDALNGFPGVYSAYVYRTLGCEGILRLMEDVSDRRSRFEAVIAYRDGSTTRLFRGVARGTLASAVRGTHGFGFDPIFVPDGAQRTFAELSAKEKNLVSHRGRALALLVEVLPQR